MSDKPLSYISQIATLESITGKDRIVLATFSNNNWRVIVQKDEFNPGDKCIYVETGSVLPIKPEYQFLEKRCLSTKYKGYKIKTMKMGDVYSEGICFKLPFEMSQLPIDTDLTERLEIRRIEDEVPDVSTARPSKNWFVRRWESFLYKVFKIRLQRMGFGAWEFPEYLIKTDETQAQSIPHIFENVYGTKVYATLKMDGQSSTFAVKDGIFTISTRNRTVFKDKIRHAIKILSPKTAEKMREYSSHAYLAAKYNIPRCLFERGGDVAIQGEVCGPGIQKNRIGLKDYELYIFNFFSISSKRYYSFEALQSFKNRGLKTVPYIDELIFQFKSINEMENYASKFKYENGNPAEGIVFRAATESGSIYMKEPLNKMHAMFSFKIINPLFKMKYQDAE